MIRRVSPAIAAVALTVLAACGVDGNAPGVIVVDAGDSARSLRIVVGQRFTIRLETNPTTGYEWQVTMPANGLVALVDRSYESHEPEGEGVAGAGGTARFEFAAASAGSGTIELAYLRPFEMGDTPDDTRSIHVEVTR